MTPRHAFRNAFLIAATFLVVVSIAAHAAPDKKDKQQGRLLYGKVLDQQDNPVVNAVVYLTNTMNIVQALDARTGDLIWENHVGPNALVGIAAMRNMAIYQDKVFVATTDARLVALDARTGVKIWDATPRK